MSRTQTEDMRRQIRDAVYTSLDFSRDTTDEEMYALIERLNGEGVTIIMISHDIAAALRYATHILHVGGGHTFFGTVDDYRASAMGSRFIALEGGERA